MISQEGRALYSIWSTLFGRQLRCLGKGLCGQVESLAINNSCHVITYKLCLYNYSLTYNIIYIIHNIYYELYMLYYTQYTIYNIILYMIILFIIIGK